MAFTACGTVRAVGTDGGAGAACLAGKLSFISLHQAVVYVTCIAPHHITLLGCSSSITSVLPCCSLTLLANLYGSDLQLGPGSLVCEGKAAAGAAPQCLPGGVSQVPQCQQGSEQSIPYHMYTLWLAMEVARVHSQHPNALQIANREADCTT